jgi:hypothetical protein
MAHVARQAVEDIDVQPHRRRDEADLDDEEHQDREPDGPS